MQAYVEVGFVKKVHGVAGEVRIVVEDEYLEDVFKAKVLLIEQRGQPIPFFVKSKRSTTDTLIVKLEDIDSREKAQALTQSTLYLRATDVLQEEERELEVTSELTLEFAFLEGFTLWDKEKGEVGVIEEVVELPQQEMAILQYEGEERLIPLNDELIITIDEAKQTVLVDLPEGLLQL